MDLQFAVNSCLRVYQNPVLYRNAFSSALQSISEMGARVETGLGGGVLRGAFLEAYLQ